MRQVPLERDINIATNGYSGFATSTQKGPLMALLISHSPHCNWTFCARTHSPSLVPGVSQGHKIDSPKMSSRGTRGHKEEETAAGWSGVHIHHGSPQCRASKRQTQKKFLSFRTKNVCEEERFADSLISAVIRCVRLERVFQNISWGDNENVV